MNYSFNENDTTGSFSEDLDESFGEAAVLRLSKSALKLRSSQSSKRHNNDQEDILVSPFKSVIMKLVTLSSSSMMLSACTRGRFK